MPEKKRKDLSREGRKLTDFAKRFIRQASLVARNFRVLGENHPSLADSLRCAYELLEAALKKKDSITYTVFGDAFFVEDFALDGLDPKVYSLIGNLKECGITSLTFLSGINNEEFELVLKAISSDPTSLRKEGGLAGVLRRKNIAHVKADEVYFKRVSKKDEEAQHVKGWLTDMLIMDYLLGKGSISKSDIGQLVGEISEDPKRIGKVLSQAALSKDLNLLSDAETSAKTGSKTPGEISDNAVRFTHTNIEKLALYMKEAGDKSETDIKKDIGNLILTLKSSLRNKVLTSKVALSKKSGCAIEDAAADFSDEIIVDIIVASLVEDRLSVVETRKLIRGLLSDEKRRKKIFSTLEKKLIRKGISQELCSKLLEGTFWADMTDEEKVKNVESRDPLYCVEIGITDEIAGLIRDLLTEKKFELIGIIMDKLLGNLSSNDVGMKIRLIRDFEQIAVLLFQSDKYPHKGRFIEIIAKKFKGIKEKGVQERLTRLATSLINICMRRKYYSYIPILITLAGYESVKDNIFSEITFEQLLKDLLSNEKIDKNLIQRLIEAIGTDAKRALCNFLITLQQDDFDSYRKKHQLARILKEVEKDAEAFFIEKLSSDNIETVNNSLEALSEIGTQKSIPAVEKLLNHKDEKIKKHTQLALKNIKKRT